MVFSRRALIGASVVALAARRARADEPTLSELDCREIAVPGDRALGRRFTLCVPRGAAAGERFPLLVLLHGLGETVDERLGLRAWLDRYGLEAVWARLRRPPVARMSRRDDWGDSNIDGVNARLATQPFRGLVVACPFTPNVHRLDDPRAALDAYARWIADVVVPRARQEAPVLGDAAHTHLDGCSLGGFVGLEVFLRRPEAFGAWGGVQSAIPRASASGYADRLAAAIARAGPRSLHLETSERDPFRTANEALATALAVRNIPHELLVLPGPHDQPWLRESGTLEMLLWHDGQPR